jgi:hypothetical protein
VIHNFFCAFFFVTNFFFFFDINEMLKKINLDGLKLHNVGVLRKTGLHDK